MSQKAIVTIAIIIGSTIGGYLPALFGGSVFPITSIITSGVGAIIGIFVAYYYFIR